MLSHGNFNIGFVMNTVVVRVRVRYIQGYHWNLSRDSCVKLEDDPRPLRVCVVRVCVGACVVVRVSVCAWRACACARVGECIVVLVRLGCGGWCLLTERVRLSFVFVVCLYG